MVYYRRRNNMVGWIAFFVIGACVFGGLVIGLYYAQNYEKKRQGKQKEAEAQQQAKLLDPRTNVWNEVGKAYKEKGMGFTKLGMNIAEKVQSSKAANKEYAVARVKHRGSSKDDEDPPEVDEVYIVETVGNTVKFTKVAWEKWETARDQFGFDEEVTKKLDGQGSAGP